MKKILAFILLLLSVGSVHSYQIITDSATIEIPDTVCYSYDFQVGDTLVYNVSSFDSISINWGKALLKKRFENIMITCDSIIDGDFYLTQRLINFLSKESNDETQNIERKESPWLYRPVWFAIDSLGNRMAVGYDDSSKASLTPGGAFQPQIIIPLGEKCLEVNQLWTVSTLDELVENGFPLPLIKQSSLFRALEDIDTLGVNCSRSSFIKTAQGSYKAVSGKDTIISNSIIAGYGVIDIGKEFNVPVHLVTAVEQKLSLQLGNNEPQPGRHYIISYFTLKFFNRAEKLKKNE